MSTTDAPSITGEPKITTDNGYRRTMRLILRPGPDISIAAMLTVLALIIRLPALDHVPPNITADEADNFQFVLQALAGKLSIFGLDWKPGPALSVHIMSWSVSLLGPSTFALRLPSVVLGSLTMVPFYFLARRHSRPVAAFAAGVLLASTLWFLHFSRSGWENVYVAFYAAMAAWTLLLALERRHFAWYGLSGLFAALGLYSYFSGRLIIVSMIVFLPFALHFWPSDRRRILVGYVALLLVCGALFAPQLPAILNNWATFNNRTLDVFVLNGKTGPQGFLPAAVTLLDQLSKTVSAFFLMNGIIGNARYFPKDRSFLDAITGAAYLLGLAITLVRRRAATSLWWCMFAVPLAATQLLSSGTPDLARAVGVVPFVFLFVAIGIEALFRWRGSLAGLLQVATLAAVPFIAYQNVNAYLRWIAQPATAQARQPAIENLELPDWIRTQSAEIAAGRRGFNVMEWQQSHPKSPQANAVVQPPSRPALPEKLEARDLPAQLIGVVGSAGNAAGQLATPRGVAIASSGAVYVADSGNRRVEVFDTTGNAVTLSASFDEPVDVAVAAGGELYVLDALRGEISKLDPGNHLIGTIGGGLGMYRPRGIALASDGRIFVADTGRNRILVLAIDGSMQQSIEGRDRFRQPTDVAVDPAGNLFVADPSNRRLVKLDSRGEFVYEAPISAANTVDGPHLALRPDGLPLATDPHFQRVVSFDYDGRLSGTFGGPSGSDFGFSNPVGIATDRQGIVYVADAALGIVKKIALK